VIQGDMNNYLVPWFNRGLTTLSGSMVLDRVSLTATTLQINGDEITVRDSNITTSPDKIIARDSNIATSPQTLQDPCLGFRVLGGRVTFEGVELGTVYRIELINTSMILSNSRISPWSTQDNGVDVSGSTISLKNSSIHAADDRHIAFKSSIVNLSDSFLQLDHGAFVLTDSHATFTRSGVRVSIGTQGMRISNSSVVASCDGGGGGVFTTGGSEIAIASSEMTFHNCSCDISSAITVNGAMGMYAGGISIDASSVHFEGCNAPKPVYPTLV
jgi:hypothetical protein